MMLTKEQMLLKAALSQKITEWVSENSGSKGWDKTDIYFSDQSAAFMTEAAWTVFLAIAEGQQYDHSEHQYHS